MAFSGEGVAVPHLSSYTPHTPHLAFAVPHPIPCCSAHFLYNRMAITMQMMKTTASTGPITQMRPSSPSTMGWGSGLSSWKGSEKGLAANVCRRAAGEGLPSELATS